ncbi:sucrase/ferredoxin domain-containing protein [Blastomyces dermatitidis ER-3]|uniref:Sucrase/ferredoxin domain-containing protein n=1 Tax=Ajellomyces dermatitidis (strain ER-3 / ATCC MYA-2586) TaxID=559297 RepID=A0ABP2F6T5_AJEDR|nr:sucrase/ferredoxin domain-containing protein [Blastomyces dermatitidis ER-3]EEQ91404.1 sucrase/ferredoxin domain-containing protein [Blastomyces dermatitidis ER-3]
MLRSLFSFVYQNPFTSTSLSTPETSSIEKKTDLFPIVDPAVDGPDCDQDCADCTIKFPARFKLNSNRELYGSVKPFIKHVLVATGRADWAPRVEGERGSLMEGFKRGAFQPRRGKMMISASNLSIDPERINHITNGDQGLGQENATTVLILPSFTFVDRVTVSRLPELMERFVDPSEPDKLKKLKPNQTAKIPHPVHPSHHKLTTRPWPRDHLILLCSHNRRDARCGISAPLIRRELERHLRPLGLYRDEDDTRPGGVGILYCVPCGRAQVRRERVDISARGGADDLAG